MSITKNHVLATIKQWLNNNFFGAGSFATKNHQLFQQKITKYGTKINMCLQHFETSRNTQLVANKQKTL